jgi:hypothetical protein
MVEQIKKRKIMLIIVSWRDFDYLEGADSRTLALAQDEPHWQIWPDI